jgi:hypothetical protein
MSNIFITDIIGSGTYAIPVDDAALAAATSGFDTILSGIANLAYDRVLAWVEDAGGPDGAEGIRTLNCMVEKFTYSGEECPSEAEVDTMTTDGAIGVGIEKTLENDANITSVDQQQVHIFQAGAYFLWNRDSSGFLYPNVPTDDVAVGPFASPNGKWFDDGDLVLGGNTRTGTERLKVVGSALIDQDNDAVGLDIDSEATDAPLINLQALVTNDRGDIAFGTSRTADPGAPDEGDVWYNATNNCLAYFDGTDAHCLQNADTPGVGFRNSEWGGNADYVPIVSTSWTVLGNLVFEGTNSWTPQWFGIIMSRPGTTGTVNVRLYDFTNALVIGTIDVTASGKAIYNDLTLANLPAAGAILEIQAKKSAAGASKGYLHYWEVL